MTPRNEFEGHTAAQTESGDWLSFAPDNRDEMTAGMIRAVPDGDTLAYVRRVIHPEPCDIGHETGVQWTTEANIALLCAAPRLLRERDRLAEALNAILEWWQVPQGFGGNAKRAQELNDLKTKAANALASLEGGK